MAGAGATRTVVGVDGSDLSHAAPRWAMRDAQRRGPEKVVHVVHEYPGGITDAPIAWHDAVGERTGAATP